jgi:alkylation response protein AidB-like acyl-CoA dehydrogenase
MLARAMRIADDVLFPRALETDRGDLVPASNLDALADAGLFGLAGPADSGGAAVDLRTMGLIVEALAGGCLSTAFIWIQHHRPVRALADSANHALRERYLAELCSGSLRAGVALGGMRDPAQLVARPTAAGYVLDGLVPWVTGWGRIDLLYATARDSQDNLVSAIIDAGLAATLDVTPLRMVACNATGTVQLRFTQHSVPAERIISIEPHTPAPPYDGGGRINGSLSLGLAARSCRMIGDSHLDRELRDRREQLDAATEETLAEARAAATELALRSAAALAVHAGSSSLLLDHHPQRLFREALFLLNFGTRPAIRDGLLRRFGVAG